MTAMPGPNVTKLLESLLDQHGLIGAIEAVKDGTPFTREAQIALLAQLRDDYKKDLALIARNAKARERREAEEKRFKEFRQRHPCDHSEANQSEKITPFDWTRFNREQAEKAKEQERERELALEVIDAGFKTLAKNHHPDKGGSTETMIRLSRARDQLKKNTRLP
jgi:hypothetical protein